MNIMKKIQADENGCKYILFRIDIYFSECFLAVEIDEKGHINRDIIFEERKQKALEKNLVVNLLELIQVIQKNFYDLDYQVGNAQAFIDEFKNNKKKLEKQLIKEKEMREKLEKQIKEKLEKEMKVKSIKYKVQSRKRIKRQK